MFKAMVREHTVVNEYKFDRMDHDKHGVIRLWLEDNLTDDPDAHGLLHLVLVFHHSALIAVTYDG